MSDNIDVMKWLEDWFYENCNGDWEHNTNIEIINLDNPGWSVFINLQNTDLENKVFEEIEIDRTENDWIYCCVKDIKFKAAGGPFNLLEILQIFRKWVDSETVRGEIESDKV